MGTMQIEKGVGELSERQLLLVPVTDLGHHSDFVPRIELENYRAIFAVFDNDIMGVVTNVNSWKLTTENNGSFFLNFHAK